MSLVWNEKYSAISLNNVAISQTGTYQTITSSLSNYVIISDDRGSTWKEIQVTTNETSWKDVALSSSGELQYIISTNNVFKSTNFGLSWNPVDLLSPTYSISSQTWSAIACSSNAQYITIVSNGPNSYGYIVASIDFGASWTQYNPFPPSDSKRPVKRSFCDISMSSDGKYQIAITSEGYIFRVYGVGTWDNTIFDDKYYGYYFAASALSSTGIFQTLVDNNEYILISSDYGLNFEYFSTTKYHCTAVAMSSEGRVQLVGQENGIMLYTQAYGRNNYDWETTAFTSDWVALGVTGNGDLLAAISCSDKCTLYHGSISPTSIPTNMPISPTNFPSALSLQPTVIESASPTTILPTELSSNAADAPIFSSVKEPIVISLNSSTLLSNLWFVILPGVLFFILSTILLLLRFSYRKKLIKLETIRYQSFIILIKSLNIIILCNIFLSFYLHSDLWSKYTIILFFIARVIQIFAWLVSLSINSSLIENSFLLDAQESVLCMLVCLILVLYCFLDTTISRYFPWKSKRDVTSLYIGYPSMILLRWTVYPSIASLLIQIIGIFLEFNGVSASNFELVSIMIFILVVFGILLCDIVVPLCLFNSHISDFASYSEGLLDSHKDTSHNFESNSSLMTLDVYQYHPLNDRIGKTWYRMHNQLDNSFCAVRVISMAGAYIVQQIITEVGVLSNLENQYICRYKPCLTRIDKKLPIAVELIIGFSLVHEINNSFYMSGTMMKTSDNSFDGHVGKKLIAAALGMKALAESQILKWFHQSLEALAYIHERRVYHRKIKPENIMINKSEDIRLINFGFSNYPFRNMFEPDEYYISYERRLNPVVVDYTDDMWALGITFAELACHRRIDNLNPTMKTKFFTPVGIDIKLRNFIVQSCSEEYPMLSKCIDAILTHHSVTRPCAKDMLHLMHNPGDLDELLQRVRNRQGLRSPRYHSPVNQSIPRISIPTAILSTQDVDPLSETQSINYNDFQMNTNNPLSETQSINYNDFQMNTNNPLSETQSINYNDYQMTTNNPIDDSE